MAFEKFVKTGRGYAPKVSIWMGGQIGFNQGAVERFNIRSFEYAVLFYDKDEQKIGIVFTNEAEEGANKIAKGKTGAFISARAFLDYYGIPHDKTERYVFNYDETNKLYVIDLKRRT